MYRKHPELYAYNIASKRHVLKSSVNYIRGIEKDPASFVDSAEVLKSDGVYVPPPVEQSQAQEAQEAARFVAPIPPPRIDPVPLERVATEAPRPVPQPKPAVKSGVRVEEPDLKEMVAEMVRAEVRQNRAAYEGKGVEDMEVLFRQMLIRKLSGSGVAPAPKQQHIDKVPAPAKKVVAKGKKMTFVVKPAQVSDDEEDEYEDE